MVATAEEDSRLFLHHQQREPEYARGKPYQPYPVVVLNTNAQSTNVFISAYDQPVKYRRYKILFVFYETLQMIMNIRINVYTFATNIVVYLKHDSCNPTQVFFLRSLIFPICLFKEAI